MDNKTITKINNIDGINIYLNDKKSTYKYNIINKIINDEWIINHLDQKYLNILKSKSL